MHARDPDPWEEVKADRDLRGGLRAALAERLRVDISSSHHRALDGDLAEHRRVELVALATL